MKKNSKILCLLFAMTLIILCGCGKDDEAELSIPSNISDSNSTIDAISVDNNADIQQDIDLQTEMSDIEDVVEDTETITDTTEEEPVIMYATDKVKVRQQPNTECDVLSMVNVGEAVTVIEIGSDGWSSVNYNGIEGYIKSEYLSEQTNTNSDTNENKVNEQVANNPESSNQSVGGNVNTTDSELSQNSNASSIGGGNGNGDNFNLYDNEEQQQTTANWVLNTSTMKIHYPTCKSVPKISPDNYSTSNLSVSELQGQGYDPCGNCHPH